MPKKSRRKVKKLKKNKRGKAKMGGR